MKRKNYSRAERVEDLLQRELATILQRDESLSRLGMMTITDISVTHDLSYAKVFISVLEEEKARKILTALNHSAKNLRYELAQVVKLRIVPELKFIYDDSSVRGQRISSLINDALKK